jgi:ISXO2-like transposase domain
MPVSFYFHQLFHAETCDAYIHTLPLNKTTQKAANLAVQAGHRLYTDSANSSRALKGYVHEFVNHTRKEYARGDVHENRAECLFSLLKPSVRVFRGLSKYNLLWYLGFF